VHSEAAAAKRAWPHVVYGLPPRSGPIARAAIRTAGERAGAIGTPGLFEGRVSASLTGPGSGLTSEFRGASLLAARGWRLIGAAIEQTEHGPAAAARFAHANVGLYIESVYDAHFTLAHIGEQLLKDYDRLGGTAAFGGSLTPAEMRALANAYSEANERLYPHTGVRLGS